MTKCERCGHEIDRSSDGLVHPYDKIIPRMMWCMMCGHGSPAEIAQRERAEDYQRKWVAAEDESASHHNEELDLRTRLEAAEAERDQLRGELAAANKTVEAVKWLPDSEALTEKLAAIEHDRWSGWMRYQEKCLLSAEVNDHRTRWARQVQDAYADLSEREKESDRKEVRRTLGALRIFIDNILSGVKK
jgi:transcription elongation factor Elf1